MFQMIWVTEGSLLLSLQGMEHTMRRGHLCIIPPGQPHALRTKIGYTQLGFDLIADADHRGLVSLMEARVKQFTLLNRSDLLPVIPGLEEKYRQFSVLARLQIAHALDDVLLSCMDMLSSQTSFRQHLIVLLEQQLSDRLTLEKIARRISFSPSHLERLTNREFGCSVMELFMRLKINKACSLLISTDFSIKQISDSLGFCDQAHFSRFFKQRMQMAPSQFRKSQL
jgi:AraC-like DNA-binding protein